MYNKSTLSFTFIYFCQESLGLQLCPFQGIYERLLIVWVSPSCSRKQSFCQIFFLSFFRLNALWILHRYVKEASYQGQYNNWNLELKKPEKRRKRGRMARNRYCPWISCAYVCSKTKISWDWHINILPFNQWVAECSATFVPLIQWCNPRITIQTYFPVFWDKLLLPLTRKLFNLFPGTRDRCLFGCTLDKIKWLILG